MRRITVGLIMFALIASATAAFAGGKGGSTSSVTLVRMNQSFAAASTAPTFGEQVTFAVETTRTTQPWVLNECFRNGSRVSAEIHGFFNGYMFGQTYTLGPTDLWTGGAADCTAKLLSQDRNKTQVLASTSYHVDG